MWVLRLLVPDFVLKWSRQYLNKALNPSSVSTKFGSKYSHTLDLLIRVGVESSELSEVFVEVLVDMLDNIKHKGKNNINSARKVSRF
jgi:hypothetical protein